LAKDAYAGGPLVYVSHHSRYTQFADVYERLGIAPLTLALKNNSEVNRGLVRIRREPCDKEAIFSLGEGLVKSGNARLAANAYLGFSSRCPNGEGDKFRAAQLLYEVGDYDQVIKVATELIVQDPTYSNYRYYRGLALVGEHRYEEALTDYANTIELTHQQTLVSGCSWRWLMHTPR
jgi:tetratricopeptide (TPR) repeat protein